MPGPVPTSIVWSSVQPPAISNERIRLAAGAILRGCLDVDNRRSRAILHDRLDSVLPAFLRLVHLAVADNFVIARLQREVELAVLRSELIVAFRHRRVLLHRLDAV